MADLNNDPLSPFYIHCTEGPGMVLVSPPLDETNYHKWSREMRMALISKNKLQFVDGSIPVPDENDPSFPAWRRCNALLISWIMHSVCPDIAKSISLTDRADEVWVDLRERFAQADIPRAAQVIEELSSIKQGDCSASIYFSDFKILWDEYEKYHPLPACACCSCGYGCDCVTYSMVKRQKEIDKVLYFLKGISDNFSHVKSQIFLIEPLPVLNKVFSLIIQQEKQLNGNTEAKSVADRAKIPSSDSAQGKRMVGQKGQSSGNGKLCSYCGKKGHTIDTCYRKHGFPPNYKSTNSKKVANFASLEDSHDQSDGDPTKKTFKGSDVITQEQYKELKALLQHSKSAHVTNQVSTSTALNVSNRFYSIKM